jgi:SAM-dependent methyltransferase
MHASWDRFWRDHAGGPFARISWSKRRITNVLLSYTSRGLAVLDAGSGSGFFSAFFIARGCETYSLDYSEQALAVTRERTDNRSAAYLRQDLLDHRFAETYAGRFGLIFSDGLFEHFSPADQDRIFWHFQTVRKPQGLIVTFVPNRYSFWTLVRPLFMPGIKERPLTLAELERLYVRNGCYVSASGGVNVLPIQYSPDRMLGRQFGMLAYAVGR